MADTKKEAAKKDKSKKAESTNEKGSQEPSIESFKGYVNDNNEKFAPSYKSYENGNTSLSFTLSRKDKEGTWHNVNVYAKNDVADRLKAAMIEGVRGFTVKGNAVTNDAGYKTIYADQIQKHQVIKISGEIHEAKPSEHNKDYTEVALKVSAENGKNDFYNLSVHKDQELNGAKLEAGAKLAVKGESSTFYQKDNKRSVSVQTWNVAPDTKSLDKAIDKAKENAQAVA